MRSADRKLLGGSNLKKKLIIVAIVVGAVLIVLAVAAYIWVMNPFNVGIDPLVTSSLPADAGRRLEISFSYRKQRLIASSQFAFWIEDMDGNYIDTLYVTQWTARGGYSYRPLSLPIWVSAAQPSGIGISEMDAISGATPRSGSYFVYWDFTDRNGDVVTATQLRYFIEGTMNNNDDVLYTGIITVDGGGWTQDPTPEYSLQDSVYKDMISDVRVTFHPGAQTSGHR